MFVWNQKSLQKYLSFPFLSFWLAWRYHRIIQPSLSPNYIGIYWISLLEITFLKNKEESVPLSQKANWNPSVTSGNKSLSSSNEQPWASWSLHSRWRGHMKVNEPGPRAEVFRKILTYECVRQSAGWRELRLYAGSLEVSFWSNYVQMCPTH